MKKNNSLTYKKDKEILVIIFPENYSVAVWSEMLDLVRQKKVLAIKFIIINLSKVKHISDLGGEFYILKNEFLDIGGKDVFIVGMSEKFSKIFELIEKDIIDKLQRFDNVQKCIN